MSNNDHPVDRALERLYNVWAEKEEIMRTITGYVDLVAVDPSLYQALRELMDAYDEMLD